MALGLRGIGGVGVQGFSASKLTMDLLHAKRASLAGAFTSRSRKPGIVVPGAKASKIRPSCSSTRSPRIGQMLRSCAVYMGSYLNYKASLRVVSVRVTYYFGDRKRDSDLESYPYAQTYVVVWLCVLGVHSSCWQPVGVYYTMITIRSPQKLLR